MATVQTDTTTTTTTTIDAGRESSWSAAITSGDVTSANMATTAGISNLRTIVASSMTTARSEGGIQNAVTVSVENEPSSLFPGLTKSQEVVILAAMAVGVLAVLAVMLRLTMPALRKRWKQKAEEKKKAYSEEDTVSSTFSTDDSVGKDSLTDTEVYTISSSGSRTSNPPTLYRLESLNLQEVYVDNWKKTSVTSHTKSYSEDSKPKF